LSKREEKMGTPSALGLQKKIIPVIIGCLAEEAPKGLSEKEERS